MNNLKNLKKLKVSNHTLKRYRDLDYEVWYALSEFIDNSIHSYLENKEELNSLGINKCKIAVNIDKVNDVESLTIEDNGGGIHPNDFERLISVGEPKPKSEFQLSEFGMGMKTASIWLGNRVEIETKHFNLDKAYKITIDIEKIGTDKEIEISEVLDSSLTKCYTKVTITQLNRRLLNKVKKTSTCLASIFKKFIENNDIELIFQANTLSPEVVKINTDSDNNPIKKDFLITLSNGKKCKGWIGHMPKGHGSGSHAGFSIYRYNRLVSGYPETSWKPSEIFGDGYSARSTRLTGELDMTEFKIAHTKNKINFIDDEENEFISQIKNYTSDIASEKAVRNSGTSKTIDDHKNDLSTKESNEMVSDYLSDTKNTSLEEITFTVDSHLKDQNNFIEENQDIEATTQFNLFEDTDYETEVSVFEILDINQPYLIVDSKESNLKVYINVGHPWFVNLINNKNSETQTQYKLNCVFDALSEVNVMKRKNKIDPNEIRLAKSLLMKKYGNSFTN